MENHNEKEILYSYIKDYNVINAYSDDIIQDKLNSVIKNIVQYNRPDMYAIINDEVIMIEHFEFDSYKSNRKGSDYRRKEGNIKNEFNKLLKNHIDNRIIYNNKIKSTATKDNYINNFISVFDEHYRKIDIYKERIKLLSNYKVDTYFFIEDISPLGSYCINSKREFRYLLIFQFKKIYNFLLSHKDVSAILYGFFDGDKKRLILLENNEESIKKLLQDYEVADELECYWFEPDISGFSFPIIKIKDE